MGNIDFTLAAKQIVDLVGGTENVIQVVHCVTRVRFTLKDSEIARKNTAKIEAVEGVIQVVEAAGQYQVVVGPKVGKMYDEVIKITGTLNGEEKAENVTGKFLGFIPMAFTEKETVQGAAGREWLLEQIQKLMA